jgi:hypothetical protein
MVGNGLRNICFALQAGGMHLCGTVDVVLTLLFAAKPPPFAALFERQFGPLSCCFCARHTSFPYC